LVCRSIKRIFEALKTEEEDPDAQESSPPSAQHPSSQLTDYHRRLRMRLSPLLPVETALNRKLSPENYNPKSSREISVRAGSNWKSMLSSMTSPKKAESSEQNNSAGRHNHTERSADDPTNILAACREDIVALWTDPIIRGVLKKQDIRLEDSAGLCVDFVLYFLEYDSH
jgi:guanine nucleotide-binding protein alpha-1 subunit